MVHEVYIDAEADTPPEVDRQIRRSVLAVLEEERVDVPCIVEVCVTDDEGIRRTNLDMRGVDRPTDVLSFPMFELKPGEKPSPDWADPDTDKVLLGDMMISLERARVQAAEFGHSPAGWESPGRAWSEAKTAAFGAMCPPAGRLSNRGESPWCLRFAVGAGPTA